MTKHAINLKPLPRPLFNKRHFDVNSARDLQEYQNFVNTGTWGRDGCPFVLEYPHSSIPDMIKERFVATYLDEIIKNRG